MMGITFKHTIVVSAVAVQDGGGLELLRQCLQYLSDLDSDGRTRVVALVHDRSLCSFPHIEYKEYPEAAASIRARKKCEYRQMYWDSVIISEQDDKPVDLWLSLFDMTPRVEAKRQAVFCRNPFPWLQLRPRDWLMDRRVPKAVYSARSSYRKNVRKNDFLVAQQDFFRQKLSALLRFDEKQIVVFPSAAVVDAPRSGTGSPRTSILSSVLLRRNATRISSWSARPPACWSWKSDAAVSAWSSPYAAKTTNTAGG